MHRKNSMGRDHIYSYIYSIKDLSNGAEDEF